MPIFEISAESDRTKLKIGPLAQFFALNKNTPTENSNEVNSNSNFQKCSTSETKKTRPLRSLPLLLLRKEVESERSEDATRTISNFACGPSSSRIVLVRVILSVKHNADTPNRTFRAARTAEIDHFFNFSKNDNFH